MLFSRSIHPIHHPMKPIPHLFPRYQQLSPLIQSGQRWCTRWRPRKPEKGRKEGFQVGQVGSRDDFWSFLKGGKGMVLKFFTGRFYVHFCCRGMKWRKNMEVKHHTNKPFFFFGGEIFKTTRKQTFGILGTSRQNCEDFIPRVGQKFGNQECSEKTTKKNWVAINDAKHLYSNMITLFLFKCFLLNKIIWSILSNEALCFVKLCRSVE